MLWTVPSYKAQLCEPSYVNIRTLGWAGLAPGGGKFGCSGLLALVTALYRGIGILAFAGWRLTGNDAWVESFFKTPGALLLVFLAGAQLGFSLLVLKHFSPGESMQPAWLFITASAAFDFAGAIFIQILGMDSNLNPLRYGSSWSPSVAATMRDYGLLLGGTCRFSLLAMGLWVALKAYRKIGLLVRLKAVDWLVLAAMGAFVASEMYQIVAAVQRGKPMSFTDIAAWPVDVFLWLLLGEALLLYRSAAEMGSGYIGRCWKALAAGVFLVSLGVVTMWAANWGYLPWPWSSVVWYIWLPAATAFALGPAYQLEAIQQVYAAPDRGPSNA